MKKPLITFVAATLLAGVAVGDQGVIIKGKAKEIRDQNNERQGVTPASPAPGSPGAPTSAAPAKPAPPVLTPQQQGLSRLLADLAAMRSGSAVTTELKEQFAGDLMATAQGPTKPSQSSVTKLANDVAAAVADRNLTGTQRARLSQDLQAVLNCANLSSAQTEAIISDAQTILKAAGVADDAVANVGADLKAIATELQKKPAK